MALCGVFWWVGAGTPGGLEARLLAASQGKNGPRVNRCWKTTCFYGRSGMLCGKARNRPARPGRRLGAKCRGYFLAARPNVSVMKPNDRGLGALWTAGTFGAVERGSGPVAEPAEAVRGQRLWKKFRARPRSLATTGEIETAGWLSAATICGRWNHDGVGGPVLYATRCDGCRARRSSFLQRGTLGIGPAARDLN